MDLAQLILLHMFCWDVWVTGLAIQGGVPTPQPDARAHTMMTGLISAMFQGFFAWRVYSLWRECVIIKIVSVLIILLALMQSMSCVAGVGLFFAAGKEAASVTLEVRLVVFTQVWMIGAVVCDLVIAVAMTWITYAIARQKSHPPICRDGHCDFRLYINLTPGTARELRLYGLDLVKIILQCAVLESQRKTEGS
ncbi:hypothetical protein L218DRAFT_996589 [Marasmius fiardii PR-910]|nr:hypothetical protein L218DRAFT_996589 [Marasmius fiardii PR-910]